MAITGGGSWHGNLHFPFLPTLGMEQFQGAETCHLGQGLPCLQNQVICYGYATKWLWVVGNERKLCQSIDIEGKNPEKPMLMLHRETSMHCCYPAIYGKSGQSWLHSHGLLSLWALWEHGHFYQLEKLKKLLSDCQSLPLENQEYSPILSQHPFGPQQRDISALLGV